jgi:DNA helicase-2/ATP-dependent DNA helicase PcrA
MDLNPRQQAAVDYGDGPLLVIAGAGSGKTRALTSRVKRLIERGVDPGQIIAITFTNKAAREMYLRVFGREKSGAPWPGDLLAGAEPFIGTFHSLGARILRREAAALGRTKSFTIYDEDDALRLVRGIIKAESRKLEWTPGAVKKKFGKVKSMLESPEVILEPRLVPLYAAYEAALQKHNAFDFDDLIEKVVAVLGKSGALCAAYGERFRYILIDEFQDVSPAQYALIRTLGRAHRNVTAVGDDAQSIYGWRYADIRTFLDFEKDWGGATVVKLEENYRSTANIIAAASALINVNSGQYKKELFTKNPPGESIEVTGTASAALEAETLAGRLLEERAERPTDLCAVLYRTNAQSRALEQTLIAAGIPYRIFGGVRFYERKEIKDIVAALRVAANPQDAVSAERVLKALGKVRGGRLIARLPGLAAAHTPIELISAVLAESGYFESLERSFTNAAERRENIEELLSFSGQFASLDELLEQVALVQAADDPAETRGKNPVQLMTIHTAKGLEFDTVFIAGCSEGLLPHQMSYGTKDELEEERRLMYVAMTRARKQLFISFYYLPSRFLYELPPELVTFKDVSGNSGDLPDEDIVYI